MSVTAGPARTGMWSGPGSASRVILLQGPLPPLDGAKPPDRGAAFLWRAPEGLGPTGLKTHAYLWSALARTEAKDRGLDEALWVNRDGCVYEGATSNLFAVLDGVLTTPPVVAGVRAGVTRGRLLAKFAVEGHRVQIRPITTASLRRADEIFVSSSVRGVLPITQLDGRRVADGSVGPATRHAWALWVDGVRSGGR